MKVISKLILLGLTLWAHQAYAQLPAVISAPISEKISRKQIVHQGVSATLLATGKSLANSMTKVSGVIKGITDQTQALHAQWYSSLLNISPGVRNYRRVQEIYDAQTAMISQFSSGVSELRTRGLTPVQVNEAAGTYQALLQENISLISELATILAANKAQMTDPQRVKFINKIADKMVAQKNVMTYHTSKCRALAQKQQQEKQDQATLMALIGAPQ
ncbi:hypothetical protein [Hymenobacter sp. YC55]|uniref:hypothetical protein n=1 Tax=Hymenobacter sp. YC55 TaxID=3034019 RepID=UPI0023F9930F|nr:hypothetical protein [Hymenobacter sp. YC55]MDF7813922.1 hypothetical protein [Hymenobacter sp. YC55]